MIAVASNAAAASAQQHESAELAADLYVAKPAAAPRNKESLDGETAEEHLTRLLDEGRDADAVRFTAIRFAPRAAVWWGALAVWNTLRTLEPAAGDAAFSAVDAAVRWVIDPSEPNRQGAKRAGEAARVQSPAGALATAVFWSGGSISLPGQPFVPPTPGVCEKLVACAVVMAATPAKPGAVARPLLPALRIGAEVRAGVIAWPAGDHEPTVRDPESEVIEP